MPTNERANKLREKKRQKDKKTKIIIWSVLGVIVLTIAVMKICEIHFADVKSKIRIMSKPLLFLKNKRKYNLIN